MQARNTLGLYGSQQPSDSNSPDRPNASAVRMIVPKLPGSCTCSNAAKQPRFGRHSADSGNAGNTAMQKTPCGVRVSAKCRDSSSGISYTVSAA